MVILCTFPLTWKEAGVHVYVAKVQPTMRAKTDDGKDSYSLWFILEGRGANRGSMLDAFCKCKDGRDGGCKHIAAAPLGIKCSEFGQLERNNFFLTARVFLERMVPKLFLKKCVILIPLRGTAGYL